MTSSRRFWPLSLGLLACLWMRPAWAQITSGLSPASAFAAIPSRQTIWVQWQKEDAAPATFELRLYQDGALYRVIQGPLKALPEGRRSLVHVGLAALPEGSWQYELKIWNQDGQAQPTPGRKIFRVIIGKRKLNSREKAVLEAADRSAESMNNWEKGRAGKRPWDKQPDFDPTLKR